MRGAVVMVGVGVMKAEATSNLEPLIVDTAGPAGLPEHTGGLRTRDRAGRRHRAGPRSTGRRLIARHEVHRHDRRRRALNSPLRRTTKRFGIRGNRGSLTTSPCRIKKLRAMRAAGVRPGTSASARSRLAEVVGWPGARGRRTQVGATRDEAHLSRQRRPVARRAAAETLQQAGLNRANATVFISPRGGSEESTA